MNVVIYTILGFLAGSVPFSYLLGRWLLRVDIRRYGEDANPGGANAWRAGGWRYGIGGGVLDFLKGAAPVALATYVSGVSGWGLVPVAFAPVVGHAYSPWLRCRGGKAVATTIGVWTGATGGWALLVFAVACGSTYALLRADAWAVLVGMCGLLAFLVIVSPSAPLLVLWMLTGGLLAWKHRRELRRPLRWRFGRAADSSS